MKILDNIKMKPKLIGLFLLMGLLPLVVVAVFSMLSSQEALTTAAYDNLDAVMRIKHSLLTTYFQERQSDLGVLVENAGVLREEGISKLVAVNTMKGNEVARLFDGWREDVSDIAADPDVVDGVVVLASGLKTLGANQVRSLYLEKPSLMDAGDRSGYSVEHSVQHNFFSGYADIHGFKDVWLVDMAGNVAYTLRKNDAFGSNLATGTYKDSLIAGMYRQLRAAAPTQTAIADAAMLSDGQAMFIGAPVYSGTVQVGMVAFQLPFEAINTIIQDRTSLGQTGETYLVGKAGDVSGYRSDRVIKEARVGDLRSGDYIDEVLNGVAGRAFAVGSIGAWETSVYDPLNLEGLNWGIVTTMAVAEAMVPAVTGEDYDFFTGYAQKYGYYDVLLVAPDGYVFYTVAQESDYQTNMVNGAYANSSLGELIQEVLADKQFRFADFAPYEPSEGKPAAFIAQPLIHDGQVEMIVALQLPIEGINNIMQLRDGMGETGESYLVGPDYRMRSDSVLDPTARSVIASFAGTIADNGVDTEAVRRALAGRDEAEVLLDYRATPVLSNYTPFDVYGTTWAMLAEIDEAEVNAPVASLMNAVLLIGGIAAAVVAVSGLLFATSLANPIQLLTEGARLLSVGDAELMNMDQRKIEQINARGDELGDIGRAFAALIGYFKSGANAMQRIAVGDLAVDIVPNGNTDLMNNAMVTMKQSIREMSSDVNVLIEASVAGKLDTRADAVKFQGEYRRIVQGVNDTLDAVIGPLNVAAEYVDRISKGDIPAKITDEYQGDFNEIKLNLNLCIDAINGLIAEAGRLTAAAVAGQLDTRGNVAQFHGAYAGIVQGVNNTLDAVIGPLNVAAEYVDRISKGDIPQPITDTYQGDFNEIKLNLNQCITAINALITDANMLSTAAVEGKLFTRADATQHQGDFRKIVVGVNDTLDAVIEPLNAAAEYVDQMARGVIPQPITADYRGDFAIFRDNLNLLSARLREMLGNIQEAATNLSSASAEILAATTQQASGASEQSASITQTTTTVDEVRTISEQAVVRAQEVADSSQRTIEVSRTGRHSVDETLESMARIKEQVEGIAENILALSDQTQQIGEITATVSDIASQSNMLALNASVEAARAGEHGKGFAVVAVEVRNLAEQSRQATAQVRTILTDIQNAINASVMVTEEGAKVVDDGVKRAAQAREAIEQLAAVINESAQIATQVVAGGQQQASGVEQIALAMQNINQAMVQSMASTRQAEKSAQDLNALAGTLTQTVRQYKLSGNGRS